MKTKNVFEEKFVNGIIFIVFNLQEYVQSINSLDAEML